MVVRPRHLEALECVTISPVLADRAASQESVFQQSRGPDTRPRAWPPLLPLVGSSSASYWWRLGAWPWLRPTRYENGKLLLLMLATGLLDLQYCPSQGSSSSLPGLQHYTSMGPMTGLLGLSYSAQISILV